MLKIAPLALGLLTLLSMAPQVQAKVANSSLQSAKPSADLHAQVMMKGGGGQPPQGQPQQSQPPQGQPQQSQPQQSQPEQRQAERREQTEQPRPGGLFGNRGSEQRPHQGGIFRERGPERRRHEDFRRPHRPHEGRGQWHRERFHDR